MTQSLNSRELRTLLALLDSVRTAECTDGLPVTVLEHARAMVACDAVSFLEFDPLRRHGYLDQSLPADDPDTDEAAFWLHYWTCAPCCYPDRSGDLLSVTTISDFYTRQQFHNTGMYIDYLGPAGVEAEAMICLSAPAGHTRRLIFWRGTGPDFDDHDRLLLALLRPHLNELYQQLAHRRQPAPTLTPRQWDLLRLLVSGHSNAEIARELVVSIGTVRKHLENVYTRLEVTNRTAAIAKAFPAPPY